MFKQVFYENENVNLATERRFCQRLQDKIGKYSHFHCLKNPGVEYQILNVHLILPVLFRAKPSEHDTNVICRLAEEELYLCKHNLKILGWSEEFVVDIKKGQVDSVFANFWGFNYHYLIIYSNLDLEKYVLNRKIRL